MSQNEMCWWHPNRKATHIVSLGAAIDRDTPACDKCTEEVKIAHKDAKIRGI